MRSHLLVFSAALCITLVGCASQSGSSSNASGLVDLNGCQVNPAMICDQVRGQSVTMSSTGLQADPRMVEQNSSRTANIFLPIKRKNGDEIFEVECGINTLNKSVSWAHVKTGPPVTDDDVKYLRAEGLCTAQ
jgi:hypothetical protein